MNKITFRIADHGVRPARNSVIEILLDGSVVAALYAQREAPAVKLISAHASMEFNDGRKAFAQWTFTFKPRRYRLGRSGEVIYLDEGDEPDSR